MISAIITGAGNSTRFGRNKMLEPIAGRALLLRTLDQFLLCTAIDEIVVTSRKKDLPLYQNLINQDLKPSIPIKIVEGGQERIISLHNGIRASHGDLILTHDGARPLTPVKLINDLIEAVSETGAAMTAINPTATVKKTAHNSLIISDTLLRTNTWIAQTPQIFRRDIILPALEKAIAQEYFIPTDDSEIVTQMTPHKVKIVPGDPTNFKITHPIDLSLATHLFSQP
ncbi:MAG: putative 2-C-methyl-D-erythritol 4-phosphate cytidylyltransferase 2 [Chlamydiae bacterium]|nr:putative 2-C-methyl-D-erythritol 4-phosphate cytidylyltransferase 2 [Chlamydiota bacterium]